MWVPALWLLWLAAAVLALSSGLDYYTTPPVERAYSPLQVRFSPAGAVGHGYGVVGTLMILVGVIMYSARKRSAPLARLGRLALA
jgi:hypothetical protein